MLARIAGIVLDGGDTGIQRLVKVKTGDVRFLEVNASGKLLRVEAVSRETVTGAYALRIRFSARGRGRQFSDAASVCSQPVLCGLLVSRKTGKLGAQLLK
ncbi:hypothetical protein D3C84_1008160 [compost metagenome]